MARKVEEINDYIVTKLVANFAAVGITIDPTAWSKRSFLRNICFTIATCQAYFEQLQDYDIQVKETIADRTPAASPKWLQDKMFKFQYSSTDPQIVALIDTVPQYPTVNTALRIITGCAISSNVSNETLVKVAKGNPFKPLDSLELASAQGYINTVGVAGINYVVISLGSDKIYIDADIYYQGQYAAVIQATTIAAIEAWFVSLATNELKGNVEMSDLEGTIKAVPGVNDVVLKNVRGRADADLFAAGIDLIKDTAILQRKWVTIAGYVGQEDTSGHTFADSLNFIAE